MRYPIEFIRPAFLNNNDHSICPIFIGSDGRIDTAKHEPDHQFNTALRILQVRNSSRNYIDI